jgi:pyruvate carboxylase
MVLKGKTPVTGRPGEHLAPVDFDKIAEQMKSFCPNPTMKDILAYCLYPKVIEAFYANLKEYSDLSTLETPVFYNGLAPGRATEVEIEEGKSLLINLVLIGNLEEDNTRRVVFELNGHRREISVQDTTVQPQSTVKAAEVLIADPDNPKDVGATLTGMISKLMVAQGDAVKENDVVAIIEAMKMETTILSKADGVVERIYVLEGQTLKAGDLILRIG